jgi:hypothetical protein
VDGGKAQPQEMVCGVAHIKHSEYFRDFLHLQNCQEKLG